MQQIGLTVARFKKGTGSLRERDEE
jgi:hypothetical protein